MKYILITILIAVSTASFSQDYLDEITLKTCECLNTISDTLSPERAELELGLCIIKTATPYKKELKRDHNIDFSEIDIYGEQLGMLIGIEMMSVCPDKMLEIVNRTKKKEETEILERSIKGQIISIDDSKFVEFSLKDNQGKISKFYWFTFIASNVEMLNDYKNLVDTPVQITFISKEFFDARINEYRFFNIISKLEKLEP